MKNHQNAPKKSQHEKKCVANAHVESSTTQASPKEANVNNAKKH